MFLVRISIKKRAGERFFLLLLTYISGEGVTGLQIFEWRKLAIVFHKNTLSLNELIGYVESTDSTEIWPEHLLSIEEQMGVGD